MNCALIRFIFGSKSVFLDSHDLHLESQRSKSNIIGRSHCQRDTNSFQREKTTVEICLVSQFISCVWFCMQHHNYDKQVAEAEECYKSPSRPPFSSCSILTALSTAALAALSLVFSLLFCGGGGGGPAEILTTNNVAIANRKIIFFILQSISEYWTRMIGPFKGHSAFIPFFLVAGMSWFQ